VVHRGPYARGWHGPLLGASQAAGHRLQGTGCRAEDAERRVQGGGRKAEDGGCRAQGAGHEPQHASGSSKTYSSGSAAYMYILEAVWARDAVESATNGRERKRTSSPAVQDDEAAQDKLTCGQSGRRRSSRRNVHVLSGLVAVVIGCRRCYLGAVSAEQLIYVRGTARVSCRASRDQRHPHRTRQGTACGCARARARLNPGVNRTQH